MTVDTQDTRRTKVLDALLALFPERSTPEGEAFETQYGLVFSLSTREPLGSLPKGKLSSIGIFGGTTERSRDFPFSDVSIPVVAEVHITKEPEIPLAKTAERYLGVVEQVLKENEDQLRAQGLLYDIAVNGDSVDIDSPYSGQVDGALYFDVKFSQHTVDPKRGR